MSSIREKLADKKTKLARPQERSEDHPASPNDLQERGFFNVDIDLITPDPKQPRKYFDPETLKELSESIKQKGVLQPVIIKKGPNGEIQLVAGERRLRAAKMADLSKIPAILTSGNAMEISLIENLQRENLRPLEEAEAFSRMIEEYHYTHDQLAIAIGKARNTITETLSLNKLPKEIKDECLHADIPKRLLVDIAKQENPQAMRSLFLLAKESKFDSGAVRDLIRKRPKGPSRSQQEIALDKIFDLINCLKRIDFTALRESQVSSLINSLTNLRKFIEEKTSGFRS